MKTNGAVFSHRPIGESIAVAESGLDLGNLDPRFGRIEEVVANRARLIGSLGIYSDDQVYTLVPEQKDAYIDVDKPSERVHQSEGLPQNCVTGDALITIRKNVGLMLTPADCVPLAMHDPKNDLLALVHLGWKGADLRLHEQVLAYAKDEYGTSPEEIHAYLGPSISADEYVTETLGAEQQNDLTWKPFAQEHEDGFHIDIPGFVIATLVNSGVIAENIIKSSDDTGMSDSGYFSYTRHRQEGLPNGRNGFLCVMT